MIENGMKGYKEEIDDKMDEKHISEELKAIGVSLNNGNSGKTRSNVIKALETGISHREILRFMLDEMEVIGRKFKVNELFVPEVLIIGRAFNVALEVMSPLLVEEDEAEITVVIGTVRGDLHDIGKNLVKLLMGSTGAKVIDLGVDVSPSEFIEAIKEHQPEVVAMSALLTTTMVQISQTIKAIVKEGLRKDVKIIIGGAPVTESYAMNVGADHFAIDAATGADIVRDIIRRKQENQDM